MKEAPLHQVFDGIGLLVRQILIMIPEKCVEFHKQPCATPTLESQK
jgi:hypothetical protein